MYNTENLTFNSEALMQFAKSSQFFGRTFNGTLYHPWTFRRYVPNEFQNFISFCDENNLSVSSDCVSSTLAAYLLDKNLKAYGIRTTLKELLQNFLNVKLDAYGSFTRTRNVYKLLQFYLALPDSYRMFGLSSAKTLSAYIHGSALGEVSDTLRSLKPTNADYIDRSLRSYIIYDTPTGYCYIERNSHWVLKLPAFLDADVAVIELKNRVARMCVKQSMPEDDPDFDSTLEQIREQIKFDAVYAVDALNSDPDLFKKMLVLRDGSNFMAQASEYSLGYKLRRTISKFMCGKPEPTSESFYTNVPGYSTYLKALCTSVEKLPADLQNASVRELAKAYVRLGIISLYRQRYVLNNDWTLAEADTYALQVSCEIMDTGKLDIINDSTRAIKPIVNSAPVVPTVSAFEEVPVEATTPAVAPVNTTAASQGSSQCEILCSENFLRTYAALNGLNKAQTDRWLNSLPTRRAFTMSSLEMCLDSFKLFI